MISSNPLRTRVQHALEARGFKQAYWATSRGTGGPIPGASDKGALRVAWVDEGDDEGWWRIVMFTCARHVCVDWETDFGIGVPAEVVLLAIEAAETLMRQEAKSR